MEKVYIRVSRTTDTRCFFFHCIRFERELFHSNLDHGRKHASLAKSTTSANLNSIKIKKVTLFEIFLVVPLIKLYFINLLTFLVNCTSGDYKNQSKILVPLVNTHNAMYIKTSLNKYLHRIYL